jgi:hypothetical protein
MNSIIPVLIAAIVLVGLPNLYFAVRSREYRKFLTGAFFVSAGMQLYFYLANISIPLLGTNIVQSPKVSGVRSLIHFLLFSICLYFGFIREPKPDIR